MKLRHRHLYPLLFFSLAPLAPAQDDLPRHGVIGLQVAGSPPAVQRVVDGSAAAQAGFQPRDVLRQLDGVALSSTTQFTRAVGRHLAGETVRVVIARGAQELMLAAVLKPRPFETSPNAEVLYRSVFVR